MIIKLLKGLGQLAGSKVPLDHDPDRLGYLIVNAGHFAHAYRHLGRRQVRRLRREYGGQTYAEVHPDTLVAFLETLMGIDPLSKSGGKIHLLVETTVRILVFMRDKQGRPFSLYRLVEQVSLPGLVRLYADTTLPKSLRDTLGGYLDSLPGFRDAVIFEERLPVCSYTHHQIPLNVIESVASVLDKPALDWFRRELATVADMLLATDGSENAYRDAAHLIHLNRNYWVMSEEDLLTHLLLRGFKLDRLPLNSTEKVQ